MAEKETVDMFELYNRASKSWTDIFNSWAKSVSGFPQAFRGVDTESWFKPVWGYTDDWSKVYRGFTDMSKMMPQPFASMKYVSDDVAKSIDSYMKIYDAWLKGMDAVAREGYEIGRKLSAGEEADTSKLYDDAKATYNSITAKVVESLKDTPFAGVKEIDKAIQQFLDSIPEEQKTARDLLQEVFAFNAKQINLSSLAMRQASDMFAEMLEKGTVSDDLYKSLLDAYGETLTHSMEILRIPSALLPEYKDIINDVTGWAKTNLELQVSWLEVNLKLYQGVTKSAGEIYSAAEAVFKEGEVSSPDEYYKRWVEACQKATDISVKSSQIDQSIPKLINKYTEYIKSMSKLYQNLMTATPFATKEEFDKVSAELEKILSSTKEKKAAGAKAKEE